METAGITAGIRGGNDMHPIFQELIRPDLILLDDVQNDQEPRAAGDVRETDRVDRWRGLWPRGARRAAGDRDALHGDL